MDVEFRTLEHLSTDEILDCFNLSFSDYLVPMHLNADVFTSKITSENIKLELSVGAFKNNKLTGFILHGYDIIDNEHRAYNGGTGVIPSERGENLTRRMYEFVLPVLKRKQIKKVQLEVLTNNLPAIKTYEQIGFINSRKLNCYKGQLSTGVYNNHIEETEAYDWKHIKTFWDYEPTWQNSINAVERAKGNNIFLSIKEKVQIVAYLVYNFKAKRVQQFAVHKNYRRNGYGSSLFNYISQTYDPSITIINVDEANEATTTFMQKLGLGIYVQQYEMELIFSR